jgi:hypothetical protein
VIGPSRRRNGTGPFVARYLHDEGAVITAVCASTQESSDEAAAELSFACGRPVKAFSRVEQMFASCALDAVAVCSPAGCHEGHLALAADAGLHTFCEKPLIWRADSSLVDRVARLTGAFLDRGLLLQQNTQWTFVLKDLEALLGERTVRNMRAFEMFLSPPEPGLSMFWEAGPHPISVLSAIGASGLVSDVQARFADSLSTLEITFLAHRLAAAPVETRLLLSTQMAQPRPCYIVVDHLRIDREVLSMSPYRLALRLNQVVRPIQDPLQRSVKDFVIQLHGKRRDPRGQIMRQFQMLSRLWPVVLQAWEAATVHVH